MNKSSTKLSAALAALKKTHGRSRFYRDLLAEIRWREKNITRAYFYTSEADELADQIMKKLAG